MTEMKRRLDETGCPAKCDFVGRLVFLYPSGHTVCQMLCMGALRLASRDKVWIIVDMNNMNFFLTLTQRQVICSICTKGGEKNGL